MQFETRSSRGGKSVDVRVRKAVVEAGIAGVALRPAGAILRYVWQVGSSSQPRSIGLQYAIPAVLNNCNMVVVDCQAVKCLAYAPLLTSTSERGRTTRPLR